MVFSSVGSNTCQLIYDGAGERASFFNVTGIQLRNLGSI